MKSDKPLQELVETVYPDAYVTKYGLTKGIQHYHFDRRWRRRTHPPL